MVGMATLNCQLIATRILKATTRTSIERHGLLLKGMWNIGSWNRVQMDSSSTQHALQLIFDSFKFKRSQGTQGLAFVKTVLKLTELTRLMDSIYYLIAAELLLKLLGIF